LKPRLDPPLAPATDASRVLIDTGPLVALYARDDPGHDSAARWLAGYHGSLHTVEAVLAEAAFFLHPRARAALAELAARGVLRVHQPDAAGHARMAELLRKYADLDPDWADIALVWLAESSGINRIATLDVVDFSALRIHGRRRFRLELLR
jgi:predicted nucleic acid-binding protein